MFAKKARFVFLDFRTLLGNNSLLSSGGNHQKVIETNRPATIALAPDKLFQ
jgi:hypothetical protein